MVLTGDFNYDLLTAKSKTQDCKQLKNLFKVFNFKQFITDPTRIAQHSSSLLDLMSTNCPRNISYSGVITSCLSDHDMVYVVRKINWKKAPAQFITYRSYANYDPFSFSKESEIKLQATEGPPSGHVNNSQSDEQDVEVLWNEFRSTFVYTADRHAPIIQKCVRGNDGCSWMTGEIKLLIRQCEFLLRKARKTNKDEDWANYRRTRNNVTNKIWSAKSLYS